MGESGLINAFIKLECRRHAARAQLLIMQKQFEFVAQPFKEPGGILLLLLERRRRPPILGQIDRHPQKQRDQKPASNRCWRYERHASGI